MTVCTIGSNTSSGDGGGLFVNNFGTLALTYETVAFNKAADSGAGIYNALGTVSLEDTLLAQNRLFSGVLNNLAPNFPGVGGVYTDLGHNLSDDGGSGWLTLATDFVNTPAGLSSTLAVQSGSKSGTAVFALLTGSKAINNGDGNPVSGGLNQSGLPFLGTANYDIGSV
jgi:hypothetical protein